MKQHPRRPLLLLGFTGALSACGGAGLEPRDPPRSKLPPYRGPLVRPEEIPENFLWQQRVAAEHNGKSGAFDAVLQKQGSELLVLGLTPFGTRGFSLKQNGTKFKYEQYVPFDLPFSPEAVLIDIHRTFFFEVRRGELQESGSRKGGWENESMTDHFKGSRLVRRTFSNVGDLRKSIEISYSDPGYQPFEPPKRVTVQNHAYSYTLRVTTASTQPL